MTRWLTVRNVLILGTTLLALGIAVAWWDTDRFHDTEYSLFTDQSLQMASVFARSAKVWLMRGNEEALGFAANLLLAGSGQYVRIVTEHGVILDRRNGSPAVEALDLSLDATAFEHTTSSAVLSRGRLDIVVPIEIQNQLAATFAAVQIGFSDDHARSQVRSHGALISGFAGGSWLLFMLVVVLVARMARMRRQLAQVIVDEIRSDGVIGCGALIINSTTCEVRLHETAVELTPKTFDLLSFLARHPGKTFSDDDLLAALWGDAPYAASGDVKQCIYLLRRRLGAACADPKRIIVNVKGFGYRLEPPVEAELRND